MQKLLLLTLSHLLAALGGFALGIYLLPILTAPAAPTAAAVQAESGQARFTGEFKRDLKDSDALHWGEGTISVSPKSISLLGRVSPGPAYKLYLSPSFVETEAEFLRLKDSMVQVGDVKTFENFIVPIPEGIDPARYTAVIVWCESFSQFITAAKYQ